MSKTIDERVVEMRFDNKQFEANVKTSMSTLEKLKSSLKFGDSSKSLEKLGEASKNVDMGPLERSVDAVKTKFSALETVAVGALMTIGNQAVAAGENMIKSLTVDNITSGWDKYAEKMASVQTIMNSTGKNISQVNEYLNKLMWFSDETSYGFTDMTAALGQLTSAGGDIDKLIPMIMGIANATAFAGKGAAEFSRVIYNLNQSYSSGALNLLDWKSIEGAGVSSAQLKETLIDVAVELGKIKEGQVTIANFSDTLKDKWADTEVMEIAFTRFAEMTEKAYEMVQSGMVDTATEAYEILSKEYDDMSLRAAKAAQEAKTFQEAIDATKDAVSSGWMNTFEIIFGNYEEAKKLWTAMSESLWEIFAGGFAERNEILAEALDSNYENYKKSISEIVDQLDGLSDAQLAAAGYTREEYEALKLLNQQLIDGNPELKEYIDSLSRTSGRENLIQSLANLRDALFLVDEETGNAIGLIAVLKQAWSEIFPPATSEQIYAITEKIRDFTEWLIPSEERAEKLKSTFKGLFAILDIGKQIFEALARVLKPVVEEIFGPITDGVLDATSSVGDWLVKISETLRESDTFYNIFSKVAEVVKTVTDAIVSFAKSVATDLNLPSLSEIGNSLAELFGSINFNDGIISGIKDFIGNIKELDGISLDNVKKVFDDFKKNVLDKIFSGNISDGIKTGNIFDGIKTLFNNFKENVNNFKENVKQSAQDISTFVNNCAEIIKGLCQSIFTSIGDFFNNVLGKVIEIKANLLEYFNLGDIMGFGLGVGLLKILKKFVDIFETVTKIIDAALKLNPLKSFNKVLESAASAIKAYETQLKSQAFSNVITSIAKSILMLVGALIALSLVDQAKLKSAIIILGELAAGLLAFQLAMTGISKLGGNNDLTQIASMTGPILAMGASLLMLSSALKQLDGLDNAGKSIGAITALMLELVVAARLLRSNSGTPFSPEKSTSGIGYLIGMVLSLKLLVSTIKSIDNMNVKNIGNVILVLISSVASLKLLSSAMKDVNWKASIAMGGLIASFLVFSIALRSLGSIPQNQLNAGLGTILVLFTAIGVLAQFTKDKTKMITTNDKSKIVSTSNAIDDVASALVKISAGMILIALAFKVMNTVDIRTIEQGTLAIGAIILAFGVVTALSKFSGENANKAGKMILWMSGAMTLLSVVAVIFSKLDPSGLDQAVEAISTMMTVFGLLIGVSHFAGESDKAAKTITTLTVAMAAMVVAVSALAILHPEHLKESFSVISGLMLSFSVAIAATHFSNKALGNLIMMSVLVAEFAGVLTLMSGLKVENALPNAAAIGILLTSLGATFTILSNSRAWHVSKSSIGKMALLGAVTAELAIPIAALTAIKSEDAVSSVQNAIALGVLLTALSGNLLILQKVGTIDNKIVGSAALLGAVVAELGAILLAMDNIGDAGNVDRIMANVVGVGSLLTILSGNLFLLREIGSVDNSIIGSAALLGAVVAELGVILLAMDNLGDVTNIDKLMTNVAGLGTLLTVLSGNLYILSKIDDFDNSIIGSAALLGAVVAELGAILLAMDNLGDGVSNALVNSGSISILLTTLSGNLYILSKIEDFDNGVIKSAALLGLVVGELGAVIWAMDNLGNGVSNSIEKAVGLSILLTALSASLYILNKVKDFNMEVVGAAALLGLVVGELALVLGIMSALHVEPSIETAGALSILLLSLSAACVILGAAGTIGAPALVGIGILAVLIAAMGGIMAAIAALTKDHPTVEEDLDRAIMVIEKIFEGLGSIVGGTIAGVINSIANTLPSIGDNIAKFGEKITDFIDKIQNIDEDKVNAVKTLAEAMAIMGGQSFLDAINVFGSIDDTIEKIPDIGEALNAFAEKVADLSTDDVESAATAGKMLAELANEIPSSGDSVLSWLIGKKDLGDFGDQLQAYGQGLTAFGKSVKGLNNDDVENAYKAGSIMAALYNEIPNTTTSVMSVILGQKDIGKFGDQLKKYGAGLSAFADSVAGLNNNDVQAAYEAGSMMAALYNEIPNTTTSVMSVILGQQNIGSFGDQLKQYGDGLSAFAKSVAGLNNSDVEAAYEAGSVMAALYQELPNTTTSIASIILGKKDLGDFGGQLKKFGQGISDYAASIDGVSMETVSASGYAAKSLVELADNLPTTSIFDGIFGGEMTIDTFGDQLKKFGQGVDGYYSAISNIKLDHMMGVTNRINDLITTLKDAKDVKKDSFDNFISAIKTLGNAQIDTIAETINSRIGDVTTAIQNVLNSIIKTLSENQTIGNKPMRSLLDSIIKVISDKKSSINSAAKNLMLNFGNGIRDSESSLKNTIGSLIKNLTGYIETKKSSFYDAGVYVAQGFVQGIESNKKSVETAGSNLGKTVTTGAKRSLEVKSPSKVFKELGGYVDAGLIEGINDHLNEVSATGAKIGETLSEGTRNYLGIHSNSTDGIEQGRDYDGGIGQGALDAIGTVKKAGQAVGEALSGGAKKAAVDGLFGQNGLLSTVADGVSGILPDVSQAIDVFNGLGGSIGNMDTSTLLSFIGYTEDLTDTTDTYNASLQTQVSGVNSLTQSYTEALAAEEAFADAIGHGYGETRINSKFKYLMSNIGEDMAIGYKNDIVPVEDAISSDFLATIAEVAAMGLETYKKWVEEKSYYGEISTYQEVIGYKLLQKQYEQGTKERIEIDKKVYSLHDDLVKGTYQYSLDWIEKEKEANRLTKEEELAAYQRMLARYEEGSDEYIALIKKITTTEKEARKELYDNAMDYIEEEVFYERMMTAEKLEYLKSLRDEFAEGTDERKKLDKEIYTLEKTLSKERYDEVTDYIEQEVYYERMGTEEKLKYLRMVRAEFKEGSEERKKLDKEIYTLEKTLAKEQYENAKKLIDEEVFYERMTTKQKLEEYKKLREQYADDAEKRKELDKEIFTLEKTVAKERYDEVTNYIEQEVFYERMGSAEKIKYLRSVRQEFKEGSDERKKIDREIYTLEKTLASEAYQSAIDWINDKKSYGQLSTKEELYAYTQLQSLYAEGSEERKKIDKEIYSLRNQLVNETYQNEMDWISNMKSAGRLNLSEELAAYQQLQSKYAEGSTQRKNIDQQIASLEKQMADAEKQYYSDIASAQKDANDKRLNAEQTYADKVKSINEKLASDIEAENNRYLDSLESRTSSLYSSYGLFDEVKEKEDIDGSTLIANLEDQVKEFDSWKMALDQLSERGIDSVLLEELQAMGPSSVKEIQAIAAMTDEELDKYVALWSIKHAMAREQATKELVGLKAETEENIVQLRATADSELAEAAQNLQTTLAQIDSDLNTKLAELQANYFETVGSINEETESKLAELAALSNDTLDDINETTKSELAELLKEISEKLSLITDDVKEMIEDFQEAIEDADFKEEGSELVEELAEGVEVSKGAFLDALGGVLAAGEELLDAFVSHLFGGNELLSPDQLSERLGSPAVLGEALIELADSIQSETGRDTSVLRMIGERMIACVAEGIESSADDLTEVLETGMIGTAAAIEMDQDGNIIWTNVGEAIGETMEEGIEHIFPDLGNTITDGLSATAHAIANSNEANEVGEALVEGIEEGAESTAPELEETLEEGITEVADLLDGDEGLISRYFSLGQDYAGNIAEGILAYVSWIVEALSIGIGDAIEEVDNDDQINSDLEGLGVDAVEGIAEGIESTMPEVEEGLEEGLIEAATAIESSDSNNAAWTDVGETIVTKILEGIRNLIPDLGNTITTSITDAVRIITDNDENTEMMSSVGKHLIESTAEGVEATAQELRETFETSIGNICAFLNADLTYNSDWIEIGKSLIRNIQNGVDSLAPELKSDLITFLNNSATEIQYSTDSAWYIVGTNIVYGIINGLQDTEPLMIGVLSSMAWEAVAAVQAELGIYSPSRVFRELGEFTGAGFIEGLLVYADKSYEAGADVADSAKDGLSDAIVSVSDYLDGDMEIQPTIRPVLDLFDALNSAGVIEETFDNQHLLDLVSQANLAFSANEGDSVITVNVNTNDVVQELHSLRGEMNDMVGRLERMQIILDSGTLVGQLAGPIDAELGRRMTYRGRGI